MRTEFLSTCDPPLGRVCVVGGLDLSTRDRLREVLEGLRRDGCSRVEVDLAEVTFVDACSLAVLHAQKRHVTDTGGTFEVVAASAYCQWAVGLSGYDGLSAPRSRASRAPIPSQTSPTPAVLGSQNAAGSPTAPDQGPEVAT